MQLSLIYLHKSTIKLHYIKKNTLTKLKISVDNNNDNFLL